MAGEGFQTSGEKGHLEFWPKMSQNALFAGFQPKFKNKHFLGALQGGLKKGKTSPFHTYAHKPDSPFLLTSPDILDFFKKGGYAKAEYGEKSAHIFT